MQEMSYSLFWARKKGMELTRNSSTILSQPRGTRASRGITQWKQHDPSIHYHASFLCQILDLNVTNLTKQ